ncbi:hypothetical protein A1O3_02653 [Capronia epimyces CBS 606.96]|uniref:Man(5)GlcNAc(2)-PP-dolichol translocation protein RFT1 n=1 Tax=Capronia epimyces CBS 606.96 TaxID=1182542 RepID=W9YK09_9EURO|nr:uncharacterized protein A1O3_02653 [Capronia epimyces CBS 606.96]EXJ89586.1 hypothetical protein A1O3_02653 [Capronia epimyces CBS 606.96]
MPAPEQTASGTLLLIFIQVSSRALTFAGNQFLLRFLSPSLLGIAVQLELVSVTTLYFARESLRVALQRRTSPTTATPITDPVKKVPPSKVAQEKDSQTVVNLSYLAVLLGLGISTFFGFSYLQSAPQEVTGSPYFNTSFRIYAFATLVELLAEPAFVVIQQKALYRERARAETVAAVARCLAACSAAVVGNRRGLAASILPFAVGQAAYALVLLTLYLLPVIHVSSNENFNLVPRKVAVSTSQEAYHANLFHAGILSLAATMYMQSIFKLLLTQGDALILSFLSSLADQGAFALASNYGGLLARLVFQPVEESSRNTFGRLLSAPPSGTASRERTIASKDQRQALKYLANTLHFYMLMALPLVSIAPYVVPVVVGHVIGVDWYTASTSSLLSTYCYYIPLMAVNGILDAFVTSVATTSQLRVQSLWMLLFTGIYGAGAWAMLKKFQLGAAGLVGASMLNMSLRIVWSGRFIKSWLRGEASDAAAVQKETIREALPATSSLAVTGLLVLALRMNVLSDLEDDRGELNRQLLGFLVAGTVLLGSTM